jgi:hypothetical protein
MKNGGEIFNRSFVPPRGMAQSVEELHTPPEAVKLFLPHGGEIGVKKKDVNKAGTFSMRNLFLQAAIHLPR